MKLNYILWALSVMLLCGCGSDEEENDAMGRFEATEVTLSAKAQGEIVRLDLEEGQKVEPGKVVGLVDTAQLALQREQLLANLSATDSRRVNAHRQLASLRQQIENLRTEQQRFQDLVAAQAATEKQLDDINYQLKVLERQLSAKEEEIGKTNSGVGGQSTAILAQVSQVDVQLRHCQICSPVAGTVVAKYVERGEYAVPGRPLFKVADLENMILRAYLTAEQMAAVKIGQRVTVLIDRKAGEQQSYPGKITWIADEAEFTPKTIQTRDERANLVYAVKIAVRNDGAIKRGMYGEVKF